MRRLCLGVVGALVMLGSAPVAGADEPLNQYAVEGAVPGYDTREGSIAATPAEAARLRARGFDVRLVGAESTASAEAIVAGAPLADPTWGYDVFRPYNLNPAPCQTTCTGAVGATGAPISLKAFYDLRAAQHPTLVKRVVYGTSVNGQELVAYRVTAGANESAEGSKPGVMFNAAQHAREWISPEVVRRGFDWVLAHSDDAASGIPAVLAASELWFVPAINPDGYDYTFQTRTSRLWRKNLRDNNGSGTITGADGVDPNRNFPQKWRYDNEGASDDPSDETYRGPSPESEPEVSSFHALMARIRPEFHVDYHSYGNLVLYPTGWQVETFGGDNPLMAALAGTDAHPAVAGYDPDVGGELYTTNGDITDTMYERLGILSYTVELDGGSGAPVGGTRSAGNPVGSNPGGFIFQDRESDVEAVFQKNLPFMLDLARSAPTPDQPVSHIGANIPDFVPTTFSTSYGTPQTVEVDVRRALGPVTVHWQVAGQSYEALMTEFAGGKRYGEPGVYFHRMRAEVSRYAPGDRVRVWFTAGGETSEAFTFTASPEGRGSRVLVLAAEDYTGLSPNSAQAPGPAYLATYLDALADIGVGADVYDIDAQSRNHADRLGVLSHYDAVIWYSGLDDYVRDPGQTVGVSKLFDDQLIAVRDYLNEGGKVLVTGQRALQGAWSGYSYNPLGRFPDRPQCRSNTSDAAPVGQLENCVQVSDDFLQYWMGASSRATQASGTSTVSARTLVAQPPFSSSFSLTGQTFLPRFSTTSADFPQFASTATHLVSGNAVGVSTADTLLWGFGLENIADRTTRATLIREGLARLGVYPVSPPVCVCAGSELKLTLGPPATFGTFTPGAAREYTASTTANVISWPGGATLAVSAPGRLSNGAHMLREPLQVEFAAGPVSHATVPIAFRQRIGASEPLHTGTYSRTLTFTLSTTAP